MSNNHNIKLPDDGKCAFCNYLSGRKPYTILKKDKLTATLVTREQRGISHLLALPIRHVPTILELNNEECCALMKSVQEAAKMIDVTEKRPGISIWQNNGVSSNQSISHVHFHIAGTLPNGSTDRGAVSELSIEETDMIAKRLLSSSKD